MMKFNIFDKDVYLSNALSLVSIEPNINYIHIPTNSFSTFSKINDVFIKIELKYI